MCSHVRYALCFTDGEANAEWIKVACPRDRIRNQWQTGKKIHSSVPEAGNYTLLNNIQRFNKILKIDQKNLTIANSTAQGAHWLEFIKVVSANSSSGAGQFKSICILLWE